MGGAAGDAALRARRRPAARLARARNHPAKAARPPAAARCIAPAAAPAAPAALPRRAALAAAAAAAAALLCPHPAMATVAGKSRATEMAMAAKQRKEALRAKAASQRETKKYSQ